MKHLTLIAAALMALAIPAMAQETTEQAPEGLSMGIENGPTEGPGSTYIKETFDDWSLRCIRVEEGQTEPCQIGQLLKNPEGSPVAEISVFALEGAGDAVAGATFIAPLETLLTAGMRVKLEGLEEKVYPFTFCTSIGCVARLGFTQAELDALKGGSKAEVMIVPAIAPDTVLMLNVSLKGFTAGFEIAATTPEIVPAPAAEGEAAPAEGEAAPAADQ